MNKAYLLMLCLISASFTGCIGGEDLEELTPEDNVDSNGDSVNPVGEDNLTGLEKRISDLEEIISDLEETNSESENPIVSFLDISDYSYYGHPWEYEKSDDGLLFCILIDFEDKNTCMINAIYYDSNGVVTSYSWEGSDTEVGNYGELCQTDTEPLICETDFGSTGSFRTDICELGDVSQTLTLTVYDNDGNINSIDYILDYEENCEIPVFAPEIEYFMDEDENGINSFLIMPNAFFDLEDYTFYLKDDTGSTYVGGNGFGEIAMQMINGEAHGIDLGYQYSGENEELQNRAITIENDDGNEFPVKFYDNDLNGKLSVGDRFAVYGQGSEANGPARDNWILEIIHKETQETVLYLVLDYPEVDNTIKIGFMNPITGPLEPDAYGFWWGADQAISDLNDMYPDLDFELIEVDSGCNGDIAQPAAYDLIDEGVVAVVGAACSGASMAANAVLSDYGIPMISYASTNPGLSDDDEYPLFYRVVPSDAIIGPASADMMAHANVSSGELAILHMDTDYGEGLAYSVKDAWEEDGHDLCSAGMLEYYEDENNFDSVVDEIVQNDDCTTVYLSSYFNDAAGIIEALHEQGWDGQIFAGDGPAGIDLYDYMTDNSQLEDVTVAAHRAGFSYGDFEERYDANADDVGSIKTYVLTAYDSVMIMGHAIAGHDDNHNLTDSIEQVGTNYEGASGLINFLDNGDGVGNGFDICTYSGDTSDANGGYSCNRFWTAENGIQEY